MERRIETLSAGEAARVTGTSTRALRHYEAKGLVRPVRATNGYRHYDAEQVVKVAGIRMLQSIGLTLEQIGRLYARPNADLAAVLAAQARALEEDAKRIERARTYLKRARAVLEREHALGLSDILDLLENSDMTTIPKAFEGLDLPELAPKQRADLGSRQFTEKDQEEVSARWAKVFAEAEALVGSDPGSERARDMAREARALISRFSGGDRELEKAAGSMWQKAWSDPERAKQMPVSPDAWKFLQEAQAALGA
jgi:DNA-binding transcriptional MerR regulator